MEKVKIVEQFEVDELVSDLDLSDSNLEDQAIVEFMAGQEDEKEEQQGNTNALKILDLLDEYQLFRNRSGTQFRNAYFDLTIAKKSHSINPLYPKSLKGDPLYWFSGLPCKGLRDAQTGFTKALDDIKELALIVQKLQHLL